MKGYIGNIEAETLGNGDFRRVLYTGKHLQLVLMTLWPGEEIGEEVHDDRDQFIRVESGNARALIDGVAHELIDGSAVLIPAGARHNIINTAPSEALRLYTLYAPPEHRHGVVHATKAEAESADEHFDGTTSE